jgi:hypothetical protein
LWEKGHNAKDIHKEMFPVYGGKCLSHRAVPNLVEKFSQRRSKVADGARPGRPVEIPTEATVPDGGGVDSRIDRVATALGRSHGLAYSIMHDRLKFRKVCGRWVPRELKDRKKINRMDLSLQRLLRYADKGEDMLNRIVSGEES